MSNDVPLPFDALRPFKNEPEDFTPLDTLPWETQAEQFLRCRTAEGFVGLRPFKEVEANVIWLVDHLGLPPGAAILDIGCGPGLYSLRLARAGYRVTGIDIAQPLLDYAQAEAEAEGLADACTYRCRSMFDLAYTAEFEAILLINSMINRLELAELRDLLVKIRAALKPGGQLLVEFQIPPEGFAQSQPAVTEAISFLAQSPWCDQFHAWMVRELTFPTTGERVTHHLILYPNGQPAEYWSRFKLYPLSKLTGVLHNSGFAVQAVYGEKLGRPSRPGDEFCFIRAQRRD
ncbi:MAG: class I SAM-dependent methyltransferase [Anaerolineae bacterium]|nr:class I SAM-dependent methyltransferase [Anaerolineae bacterium]